MSVTKFAPHIHTYKSLDSQANILEIIFFLMIYQIDYFSITDHDSMAATEETVWILNSLKNKDNLTLKKFNLISDKYLQKKYITSEQLELARDVFKIPKFIPGVEITSFNFIKFKKITIPHPVHILFHHIDLDIYYKFKKNHWPYLTRTDKTLEWFQDYRESILITVAHPWPGNRRNIFYSSATFDEVIQFSEKKQIDAIEVINKIEDVVQGTGIDKKRKRLAKQANLSEMGGADAHSPEKVVDGYTLIEKKCDTKLDLIEAIKSKKSIVKYTENYKCRK